MRRLVPGWQRPWRRHSLSPAEGPPPKGVTPIAAPGEGALRREIGEGQGPLIGSRRFDHAVILGLTGYLATGPFQRHPPPGWVDPAMYLGYFLYLPDLIQRYGPTYHSNRWLFTLTGYAVYHLFSPAMANLVLVTGFYLAILYAFWALLLPFCTPGATRLALVLMGSSPLVIATVTRTYVDGLTLALMLAGLAALLRGILLAPPGRWLFVAGAAFTAAVLTQPGSTAPILAGVTAAALAWRREAPRALRGAGGAFLGALCVVIVFAGLSQAVTGQANFAEPALKAGSQVLTTFRKYGQTASSGLRGETRLWLLVGGTLASGALLLGRRRAAAAYPAARRLLLWSFLGNVTLIGCVTLGDLWANTGFLQLLYVSTYLLPLFFVMLGAVIQELVGSDPGRFLPAAGAVALLGAWGAAVVSREWGPENPAYPALGFGGLLVIAGGTLGVIAVGRPRTGGAVVGLFAVAAVLQGVNFDTRPVFADPETRFADSARCLHAVAGFIRPSIAGQRVLFWFNRDGYNQARNRPRRWLIPQGGVYPWMSGGKRVDLNLCDSVNALYLGHRSRLNLSLPALSSASVRRLKEFARNGRVAVVLLSDRRLELQEGQEALRRVGFAVEALGTKEFVSGHVVLCAAVVLVDTSAPWLEVDEDRDGRTDRWQRWKGSRLAFEDVDTDGDGKPDTRWRYGPEGKLRLRQPLPR